MRNRMLVLSFALLLVLLCIGTAYASPPLVGVRIDGPDVGWVDEELTYWGDWACHFDEETLQELYDGRATVGADCEWEIDPAAMVGGNGREWVIIRYAYQDGAAYHTVKLTVTATVTYADGTSDTGSGSASVSVKVRRPELDLIVHDRESICAGAGPPPAHWTRISGEILDGFGDPAPDFWVLFYHARPPSDWVNIPDRLIPNPALVQSDEDGNVQCWLVSSDKEGTSVVKAVFDWPPYNLTCDPVAMELPEWEPDPEQPAIIARGGTQPLSGTLTHEGIAVESHTIAWDIISVYDENGDLVIAPDPQEYGSVTQTSVTDEDGVAEAMYVGGTKACCITVQATDMTCYDANAQHPILGTYTIYCTYAEFDCAHDYIVPGSSLNTIRYRIYMPPGAVNAMITVTDSSTDIVREMPVSTSNGLNIHQWDGKDDSAELLTATAAPYTYDLDVTYEGQSRPYWSDTLAGRGVLEWGCRIFIRDRYSSDTTFETGVNEETIADENGEPVSFYVSSQATGASCDTIAYYEVYADTGEHGWDSDIDLLDSTGGGVYIFYTTPTPDPDLPLIDYVMELWETDPYVQDVATNEWDMDPTQAGQQTKGTWEFRITPFGEIADFVTSYE